MNLKEKKINSKKIYDGVIMSVHVDEVELPNKEKSTREYSKHGKACCVVAKLENGKFLLEKQFRYPLNEVIYEFPAGKCDKDEDTKIAALRELKEETGYSAQNIIFLGNVIPACAYSDEILYIYYCDKLVKGDTHLDANEFLEVLEVSEEEIVQLIKQNKIQDSKTIAAFYKYQLMVK